MQPGQAGSVEPGQTLAPRVPHALGLTPLMAPSAHQQNIAFVHPHRSHLLSGVQVFWINRVARFEPLDFSGLRNIKEDAAADDTVAGHVDRTFLRAKTTDLAITKTIVHPPVPKDV